jgi:hypothetical protein
LSGTASEMLRLTARLLPAPKQAVEQDGIPDALRLTRHAFVYMALRRHAWWLVHGLDSHDGNGAVAIELPRLCLKSRRGSKLSDQLTNPQLGLEMVNDDPGQLPHAV